MPGPEDRDPRETQTRSAGHHTRTGCQEHQNQLAVLPSRSQRENELSLPTGIRAEYSIQENVTGFIFQKLSRSPQILSPPTKPEGGGENTGFAQGFLGTEWEP